MSLLDGRCPIMFGGCRIRSSCWMMPRAGWPTGFHAIRPAATPRAHAATAATASPRPIPLPMPGPAGWTYRVLSPAVDGVSAVAAELGWPPGTPSFPETVVYDERSARLLLAAHVAAERGDRLASSSLLTTALSGLLRGHARPGPKGLPPPARRAPGAGDAVRGLLAERLTHPPRPHDPPLATGMSPFALLRAFRHH